MTTGPKVPEFENRLSAEAGVAHAVAVSSGTAALHTLYHAVGIGPGDEVIVPAITFAATANALLYLGATPVFADVEADTLLLDPESVSSRITPKTRAIVAVDYAGQMADYVRLRELARKHNLLLLADSCHSLGGRLNGLPIGNFVDGAVYSFHPVKHITTAEGGMVLLHDEAWAARARRFRNHGIETDHRQRAERGTWRYDVVELGYNYRLSDLQCALGLSQFERLPEWIVARQKIADRYTSAFAVNSSIIPLTVRENVQHAWHLYVVKVEPGATNLARDSVFDSLRNAGIGANVHYGPVHLNTLYRERFGFAPGLCPVAESESAKILSLPMYPSLKESELTQVIDAVAEVTEAVPA